VNKTTDDASDPPTMDGTTISDTKANIHNHSGNIYAVVYNFYANKGLKVIALQFV
jgi:hypothetical protein